VEGRHVSREDDDEEAKRDDHHETKRWAEAGRTRREGNREEEPSHEVSCIMLSGAVAITLCHGDGAVWPSKGTLLT